MRKLRIFHETVYAYDQPVQLGEQRVLVRPRDGHDIRIESSRLTVQPEAQVVWYRDELDNSVARLCFPQAPTRQLTIISEVKLAHYGGGQDSLRMLPAAVPLPVPYTLIQQQALQPWLTLRADSQVPESLVAALGGNPAEALPLLDEPGGAPPEALPLLKALNSHIHSGCAYAMREEPGVKPPAETLESKEGSCRDYAWLFVATARQLGMAARFVSGYLLTQADHLDKHTHAWAEVYLPLAGWIGFDPTCNCIVGNDHVPVSVSRFPEDVPPVSGTFTGPPGTVNRMAVNVKVTEVD